MSKGREITIGMDSTMFSYVQAAADSFKMPLRDFVSEVFLQGFKDLTAELARQKDQEAKQEMLESAKEVGVVN